MTSLESLAVRMHVARREVLRLKKERAKICCQGDESFGMSKHFQCWFALGRHSKPREQWCEVCAESIPLIDELRTAARELSNLKHAFWRMASRLAKSDGER